MSPRGRLAGQTLLLAFAQWLSLGVGFLATVLIARALGPEGRGVYAWLLTLTGLAVQVAALAPNQTVRGIAGRRGDDPAFVPTLIALSLFGTLLGLPVFAYAWAELPGGAGGALLLVAWAAVPLTAASVSIIALVQIEQRLWPILWAHLGPKLALLIGAGALWAADRLDLAGAVWLNTGVAAVQLGLLLRLLPSRPASRPRLALARGKPLAIVLPPALALVTAAPVAWLAVPPLGAGGAVVGAVAGYAVLAVTAALLTSRSAQG